jgi:hypothetical protein
MMNTRTAVEVFVNGHECVGSIATTAVGCCLLRTLVFDALKSAAPHEGDDGACLETKDQK